ncbi:MAG: hypothetical protein WBE13_15305 [Candidatus Acidiferrum sp.]
MKISAGQYQAEPVEPPNSPAIQAKDASASTSSSSSAVNAGEKATVSSDTSAAAPLQRQTDVTYRQDSNGRVYYSVSDAKSGQEILEVPPKILRDVSQGIEDYVKQEQSRASSHVEVKA